MKKLENQEVIQLRSKQKGKRQQYVRVAKHMWGDRYRYLMLLPFISFFAVFSYWPAKSMIIAFQDYSMFKGIAGSEFVGVANFIELFAYPNFWRAVRNTFTLGTLSLAIGFPMPIIVAVLLNELRSKWFKRTAQAALVFPYFLSVVILAGLMTNMLSPSTGVVNFILEKLGFEAIYFLTVPSLFPAIYVFINLWRNVGIQSLIYTAALNGVPLNLYEAATLDGANKWKQFTCVTLPYISPTIIMLFIMGVGSIINVGYEAILLLYQPATYETADVLNTLLYRLGLENGRYDLATAAGLLNTVVSFILVISANKISRKFSESSLW